MAFSAYQLYLSITGLYPWFLMVLLQRYSDTVVSAVLPSH